MVFTLRITGPPAIEAAFTDFSQTMIRYGLQEPVDFAFKTGEQMARNQAPVKTGFLRSSIRSERTARGARLIASAPYALYVDKRVPYFSNAVAEIQRILPGLVQQAINEQAGRISRKFFGG
jgi:hypothetical protein